MALPDSLKLVTGTAIIWADTTDYTDNNGLGARTHQIDLTGVADSAYRQGAKADFGVNRAPFYRIRFEGNFAATPGDGKKVIFYIAWSEHATAGTGNDANASGTDADYTGYSTDADDAIEQADKVGEFTCVDSVVTTTEQLGNVPGHFRAKARYGSIIVRNESGAAFHTDGNMDDTAIAVYPVEHQVQD